MTQYQVIIICFWAVYVGGLVATFRVLRQFSDEYIAEGKCPDIPAYRAVLAIFCTVVSIAWPAWWLFVIAEGPRLVEEDEKEGN